MVQRTDDRGSRRRDTHHAVNADILQKLGGDGYVVNISRGSVIDQAALSRRSTTKPSPAPASTSTRRNRTTPDALTALPNVVLIPHMAVIPWIAHGDAGLRDRQSGGVFCRQAAGLPGGLTR